MYVCMYVDFYLLLLLPRCDMRQEAGTLTKQADTGGLYGPLSPFRVDTLYSKASGYFLGGERVLVAHHLFAKMVVTPSYCLLSLLIVDDIGLP